MGCTGLGIDFSLTVKPISGIRHFSFAEPTNAIEGICKQASLGMLLVKGEGRTAGFGLHWNLSPPLPFHPELMLLL